MTLITVFLLVYTISKNMRVFICLMHNLTASLTKWSSSLERGHVQFLAIPQF